MFSSEPSFVQQPSRAFPFMFDAKSNQQNLLALLSSNNFYYLRAEMTPHSLAVAIALGTSKAVLHDLLTIELCDKFCIYHLHAFLFLNSNFPHNTSEPNYLISTGFHLTDCYIPTTSHQGRKITFEYWHRVYFSDETE